MGSTVISGGQGVPSCLMEGAQNEAREAGFIERPVSEQLLIRLSGEERRVRWEAAQAFFLCDKESEQGE